MEDVLSRQKINFSIYTSYFARVKQLPEYITPVSISLGTPHWLPDIAKYPILAPKPYCLFDYKANPDQAIYRRDYFNEILLPLNLYNVIADLKVIAHSTAVCLLCYERSDDFCHRHLFREYYNHMLKDMFSSNIPPIYEFEYVQ